jgi:hypothetical protein
VEAGESEGDLKRVQRGSGDKPPQQASNLVRIGILALPLAGLLALGGLLGRYNIPNPRADPEAAAKTAGSTGYFLSQLLGNVLGLTLLIFGVLALAAYLADTRARVFAQAAMVLSIAGITPVLSAVGVTTYALPVLSRAYLNGRQDALAIITALFDSPWRTIFVFAFVSYAAGFVLFGVAIWRSGVIRKGAALSLGLHAPLVSSFIRPQPGVTVVLGALLFVLGGVLVSLDVFRGPTARRRR